MIYNGNKQDYHFIQTLDCLYAFCDEVVVCCGGDDGTVEDILKWVIGKPGVKVIKFTQEEWDSQQGREKLSYFSNMAISFLSTDWNFYLQCDEILHESCYKDVRSIIEIVDDAVMCSRINLWATPYTMLNVPQDRKPVSTEVIRLAKTNYRCFDDAESIGANNVSMQFIDNIRIYHTGFVRDKDKHLVKIKHMQEEVFLWDVDKRIHDNQDGFDCWKWGFYPEDVTPITEPLPFIIKAWAHARYQDPFRYTTEGYEMAMRWIKYLNREEEWIGKKGFSTDGWSVINEINSLWREIVVK